MNIILALIIAILVMIIGIEHDPNKEERSILWENTPPDRLTKKN